MKSQTDKTVSAEHKRAHMHSVFFDLSHRGRLILTGKDHLKFLQGILSNDVLKLSGGEGTYAFMLNPKGRILTDMRLFRKDGQTVLDLESEAADKTAERMNALKLSYGVEIEKAGNHTLFHLTGREVRETATQLFGTDVGEMKEFDHLEASVTNTPVWAARVDRTGQTGFDIEGAPENRAETLRAFAGKNVIAAGPETFDLLRIEAGIPEYGKDMDESVIAPETGLQNAVSFEKGCYVGQEIVARAHWRGRVNRHFARFVFEGKTPPSGGTGIVSDEGKAIGRVTSSAFSPSAGAVAVGYIRREFKSPGTEIKTENGQKGKIRSVNGRETGE